MKKRRCAVVLVGILLLSVAAHAEDAADANPYVSQTTAIQTEGSNGTVRKQASTFAEKAPNENRLKAEAVSIGLLQGGGSLIGADFEFLTFDRLAMQVGAGLLGYGAAVNYHFQPTLDSSYLSLSYWHQGLDNDISQQAVGLTYGIRAFHWLTAQIGLGYVLARGDTMTRDLKSSLNTDTLPQVMLLYSFGVYF